MKKKWGLILNLILYILILGGITIAWWYTSGKLKNRIQGIINKISGELHE